MAVSYFFRNFAESFGRIPRSNAQKRMKQNCRHIKMFIAVAATLLLTACNQYNALYKTQDYEYKYEAAKQAFVAGHYVQCYQLLDEMIIMLKGTDKAEESLIMDAMCHYNLGDYESATTYFDRYHKTYPRGEYTELARFYSGKASYLESPDPRLDQSPTYTAINSLQDFLEFHPYSERRDEANDMLLKLQNRLVQKEYNAAKLYYDLGNYVGNCSFGGSNYEASIITAENALKTYPYTNLREELYLLILKARYELAVNSVDEKANERYQQCIDEYYGFKNEFPESEYTDEADRIFRNSNEKIQKK